MKPLTTRGSNHPLITSASLLCSPIECFRKVSLPSLKKIGVTICKSSKRRQEREMKAMGVGRLSRPRELYRVRPRNQDLNKKAFASYHRELTKSY
jgi:hypothetical protein